MKIHLSKIEREENFHIGEHLPKGKCNLTCFGEDSESIWVAHDEENKVMYLLNHAINMYPYPSWGMELPLATKYDIGSIRGESADETEFSVCPEVYYSMKEAGFIGENDEFDSLKYFES